MSGTEIVESPSSRRAWIEIKISGLRTPAAIVALLAEGVDRNYKEIDEGLPDLVALLAEGVDRNGDFCAIIKSR